MYEDNLIPLFETIGAVVQFRLMMNHSGRNRGFGYIIYVNPVDAHRAIKYLNNILVSSWCRLQLVISRNTRDLWLGNVSYAMNVNTAINLILDMVDPEEVRTHHVNNFFRQTSVSSQCTNGFVCFRYILSIEKAIRFIY